MIFENMTQLIGKTPLMRLNHYRKQHHIQANLFAKLEYFNPGGRVKDRVAKEMIEQSERDGKLKPGSVIIEPTSGNTGIGLAAVATAKGYKALIVMPETMSIERRNLMKAYGAQIILTDGAKGMKGAVEKAEELTKQIPASFMPGQFSNPANPEAHKKTTAVEIWEDMQGDIDIFVAGVGTGGTITGVGEYLKSKNPTIQIIAVEPAASPVLSKGKSGPHKIQGIGANFVPEILNTTIFNEIITISDENAYTTSRNIAKSEGILIGISSGAALHAAEMIAQRTENKNKNIVVLFPDTGDRYLSTPGFIE